jgi:hypothetical protein
VQNFEQGSSWVASQQAGVLPAVRLIQLVGLYFIAVFLSTMDSETHLPERIHHLIEIARSLFHELLQKNNSSPYDEETKSWPTTSAMVEWANLNS